MCTTACMQVGMAILCNQINLSVLAEGMHPAPHEERKLVSALDWCMDVASVVHGRVETLLDQQQLNTAHRAPSSMGRMISVNDLIRTLDINLQGLGISSDELVVCSRGSTTGLIIRHAMEGAQRECTTCHPGNVAGGVGRDNAGNSGQNVGRHVHCWLMYEPQYCYVTLSHLPLCMIVDDDQPILREAPPVPFPRSFPEREQPEPLQVLPGGCGRVSIGIVTAHGHSVCICCYGIGRYALFDSSPGRLCFGMTGPEMVSMLKSALRIPDSSAWANKDVLLPKSSKPINTPLVKRRKDGRKQGAAGSVDDFYCDVTLFYVRKRFN